jgi:hypothetical protein
MRKPGRVDHGIHSLQRRRHVLRPGKIAYYGARGSVRQRGRSAQEHANAVPTLRQFPQHMLPDEAGGTGECKQHAAFL